MDKKETTIRRWFDMWLQKTDSGITEIFSKDAVYVESWGPKYTGAEKIKHWFQEWNTRGKVLTWDIKQYFHKENQTIVEWYFESRMGEGKIDAFDGISLIEWTPEGKISFLKEFGCNTDNYDPYQNSPTPHFREAPTIWS